MLRSCHTHTDMCMQVCMYAIYKGKQTRNRRKHAILSDVLHKSLLSKRWSDRSSWTGCDGSLFFCLVALSIYTPTTFLNILEFAELYFMLFISIYSERWPLLLFEKTVSSSFSYFALCWLFVLFCMFVFWRVWVGVFFFFFFFLNWRIDTNVYL